MRKLLRAVTEYAVFLFWVIFLATLAFAYLLVMALLNGDLS